MLETGAERTARAMQTFPLDPDVLGEIRLLVLQGWIERMTVRGPSGDEVLTARIRSDAERAELAPVWIALGAVAALAPGCTVDAELREEPAPPVGAGHRDIPVLDHE